ncbi:MAG: PspA/IM30 family protein, partial [Spirochaetales bacterium]|nr:PspA/IM30 family protein [Spirochaetales bacterium]
MGVFTRFKDIVNSNINSMLDKAEDPEKMINLMIREMEDTLVELKTSCAASIADKTKTERERDVLAEKVERWGSRAKLAVEKGREDLAREALLEKKNISGQLELTENDLAQFEEMIKESKSNIAQLEEKLETVKQKRRILIQRGIHAKEKMKARQSIKNASGVDATMRFEDLESRIERMEADADMVYSDFSGASENEFAKMEHESDIEEELASLKKSMKPKKEKASDAGA